MKQFIRDAEPEMRQDLSKLIQTLKRMIILESDQQRIVSLIVKWQQRDRLLPNVDKTQTPVFNHFLSLSKMTSYSTRSARNAWIEESASVFDGLFYTLTGGHRQEFQRVLAYSAAEATSGPAVERAENEWKGMGRQIGLGGYGIVQGMGLSLAGAFDSAAQTATGAAQSVLSMTGSHYQLAAPLALTPFISNSYNQLTPQVRQALGANESNDVHIFGMTGDQFSKLGGQGIGQLMMSGFGKAAEATRYVQALKKGAAVLQATQAVDVSLHHLTDLIVAKHERDPNAAPATYLLDDDILSEMCVTLDAVADLGTSLVGGNKTKKTATLRQVLRKMHLAARFGRDVVTAASTADTLIARAEVLYESRPNISATDIVTDPTILEAIVAFAGSASDAAQVGSGVSGQAQKLGKWSHLVKTSADFIAPVFQARQALVGMSDQALVLHRHDPHHKDASLLMDTGMQSHMLDVLSSAGMMASAGSSRSRPGLRLLAAHTAKIISRGRKGVAFEDKHGTSMVAQSSLDRFKSTASVATQWLGGRARSGIQGILPHFGGDGTLPLMSSTLPGGDADHPTNVADGGMTGPFYPAHWTKRHYRSAGAALNDSANVAVYVNGVQTSLGRHTLAAQELAQQIGKPVVGIYNAAGSALQDIGQSATDKFGILGMGKRNAATNTLARVIGQHGSPAAKNGGLDLYAHSQGGIIVSEAIRQAKSAGHDVRGLDVTTFGGAAWSRPAGLRGYHNYAYDSDVIPTLGGSTSVIGALLRTPFNRSNPLNPIMGGQGMTSTADDTFTLHHRGAGGRPHGVIPDPLLDASDKPILDKKGHPVLDSEDSYIKSLPKFRAKEAAVRARLNSLGPMDGPLASEALNSAMVTRSLGATGFAFAKSIGAGVAGLAERSYGAASGMVRRGYSGAANLVQTGYGETSQRIQQGYTGAKKSAAGAYSEGAGGIAAGYGRLDGWMRRLPSLPGTRPNTIWGALDRTFRGGGEGLDHGLRGGGTVLDHGLRGLGQTTDTRLRGSAAAYDSAARSGGGLLDRGLRRMGTGVSKAGRRGADAMDDYYDTTNALQRSGHGDHPDVNPAALRADLRKQSNGFLPDGNIRAKLGGHLGFDPGGARLHTDPAAASASRRLNAEAFTIGNDVFFGEGRFDPHTPQGLGLIAHELTHVGQQTGTTGSKARFFTEAGGDQMEREAQHTAENVLANAGSRSGLFVEDYIREYEGEGGLTQADQQRLDRISVMALTEAQRMLANQGMHRSVNADALDVQVEIDLGEMTDSEAARLWAKAMTTAVVLASETFLANPAGLGDAYLQRSSLFTKYLADTVLLNIGRVKGVALTVTDMADTVVWLGYKGASLATGGSMEKQPPKISDATATLFDKAANKVGDSVDANQGASNPLWLNSYEIGEIEGALGAQVGLSLVGAEEVQKGLVLVSLVSSFEGLVDNVLRTHKDRPNADIRDYITTDFLVAALNLVSSVLGLSHTLASKKIIKIIISGGMIAAVYPPLRQFFKDYENHDPAINEDQRHKTLYADAKAVVMAVTNAVLTIVQQSRHQEAPHGIAGETSQIHAPGHGLPETAQSPISSTPRDAMSASGREDIARAMAHVHEPMMPAGTETIQAGPEQSEATPRKEQSLQSGKPTERVSTEKSAPISEGAKVAEAAITRAKELGVYDELAAARNIDTEVNEQFTKAKEQERIARIIEKKAAQAYRDGDTALVTRLRQRADEFIGSAKSTRKAAETKAAEFTSILEKVQKRLGPNEIATPYGVVVQDTRPAFLQARDNALKLVQRGAVTTKSKIYKVGSNTRSHAVDAQFWMLEDPTLPGVAERYGIPPENVAKADFIITAELKAPITNDPSTIVTRPAADYTDKKTGKYYPGGATEIVVLPEGVENVSYHGGAAGKLSGLKAGSKDLRPAYEVDFDRLKAQFAAEEIEFATPVGSALQNDPYHRFPDVVIRYSAETGKHFTHKNGDGSYVNLFQVEGGINVPSAEAGQVGSVSEEGIFEWIVDTKGNLTHRRFIGRGKITGLPNQGTRKKTDQQ